MASGMVERSARAQDSSVSWHLIDLRDYVSLGACDFVSWGDKISSVPEVACANPRHTVLPQAEQNV